MQESARLTVPGGPSVACSAAAAVAWDEAWANNMDPSGMAATGVHDSAYEAENHKGAGNGSLIDLKVVNKVQEVRAVA